jgi:uncharacterized protein
VFYQLKTGLYQFLASPQNIPAKAGYSCAKASIHAGAGIVKMMLLIASCLLFSTFAQAELVAIPELSTRVTDLTQTLSQAEQTQLEQKLAAFEEKKGSQIALLIVPSTQPEEIEQYAIRVVEKWKIGREKVDDGLLVLIAKDDRKMRIEVGYGLEGAVPDLYAKRIISEIIGPKFKQGDFYGGLDAGVDSLIGLVDGEPLPAPVVENDTQISGDNLLPLMLFGTVFLSMLFTPFFGRFLGSTATGGVMGLGTVMLASMPTGIVVGLIAFVVSLLVPWLFSYSGGSGSGSDDGYYGGSGGGWSSGGSSWGGGGGGFGGGGASGDW